jgi:membrane protease YdiL (CAAX protease family)
VRRDLLVGFGIGALGVAVMAGLMLATGHAEITSVSLDAGRFGLGLLVFGVAALVEEVLFRAFLLGGLRRLTGSAGVALVLSAALFGLVHLLESDDATVVSVVSNTVGGLMYGIAYLRSGRIWLGAGVHVAWNFVQGTVLGFVVSGNDDFSDALMHVTTSGAQWLSGGGYGPEGSVFSLVGRAVIIGLLLTPAVVGRGRAPDRR